MFKQELQVFPTHIRVCLCNQQKEEENARETTIAIRKCANELANHTQRAHTINEPRTRRPKNYIFSLFIFPVRVDRASVSVSARVVRGEWPPVDCIRARPRIGAYSFARALRSPKMPLIAHTHTGAGQ